MTTALDLLHDLAEKWPEDLTPTTEKHPTTIYQHDWAIDGVVILRNAIPEHLMAEYERAWMTFNGGPGAVLGEPESYEYPMGWSHPTPYMRNLPLRQLATCPEISSMLAHLIGEPCGLHLCLTGWQSTRRDWHFDQYLNPPHVGAFYLAAWIALDDIGPDSGPFEYIPGSHRWWPPISQAKMRAALGEDGQGSDWPTKSERILSPLFENLIRDSEVQVEQFLPSRGDVLFWHSRLLHRGSIPVDPAMERRAVICHYSGVNHRSDMPHRREEPGFGPYFWLPGSETQSMGYRDYD